MKKYKVCWGGHSSDVVPGMNPAQAIEVACKKFKISSDLITSVVYLGDW